MRIGAGFRVLMATAGLGGCCFAPVGSGPADAGNVDAGAGLDAGTQASCTIGGAKYLDGFRNPQNLCQACQPSISLTDWTNLGDGSACASGICSNGTCQPGCKIGGTTYATGAFDPSDPCRACDPSLSPTAFSSVPNGNLCGDGGSVCVAGLCQQACVVAGILYPVGAMNPGDSCLSCQRSGSGAAWGVFDGAALGPCDGGQVCDHGTCRVGCLVDGRYEATRSYKPGALTLCCNPSSNPSDWTQGFQEGDTYAVGTGDAGGQEIAAGDFNHDGLTDVAVLSVDFFGSSPSTIALYLNQGGAHFGAPSVTTIGSGGQSLSVGDLNGDGYPDLVVRDSTGVGVLLENGGAGLLPEQSFVVSDYGEPNSVALGDVDGNGSLDIVTVGVGSQTTSSALLNDGHGGLQPEVLSDIQTFDPLSRFTGFGAVLGDFDGDGILDLGLLTSTYPGVAEVAFGLGAGRFGNAIKPPQMCCVSTLWAGTLGGSSRASLVLGYYYDSALTVLSALQAGAFSSTVSYGIPQPLETRGADVNGDGIIDLVSVGTDSSSLTTGRLSLLLGLADGGLAAPSGTDIASSTYSAPLAVGAFQGGSGKTLDVAVLNSDSTWTLWLNGCP